MNNKEIIDTVRRRGLDETLASTTQVFPAKARREIMQKAITADYDSKDPNQEAWYQANERYENNLKNYSKSRWQKIGATALTGLVMLVGAPKAVEYFGQDQGPVAEASGELESDSRERWVNMHDFRQAGFENVSTLWQIAELIDEKNDTRKVVADLRELNQIDANQVGRITAEQNLLISTSNKYDERLQELGFELVEKEHEDGTPYLDIEASQ